MRLISFSPKDHNDEQPGVLVGDSVMGIRSLLPHFPTMKSIIEAGPDAPRQIADKLAGQSARFEPLANYRTAIPVPDPGKIICLGLNYAAHAAEGGNEVPTYPALFLRATTSLIADRQPMVVPSCSEKLDYEAELMVVVGKRCRHLDEENALDAVFGYTLFNDGSVRDYQRKTAQWTAGKNFDGTGAVGPCIVTADELPAGATGLQIRSRLGDRILQDSNTDRMIFSVAKTLAILSEVMTLEPGDLIATGTPNGVGHARTPPLWLKPGDVISVDVEGVGTLSNPVVAE